MNLPDETQASTNGLELAKLAAQISHDNKAEDVIILDLRGISSVTDFFVIATCTSDRQIRAVADHIEEHAREVGQKPFGISGYDSASWLLADYVDVVVHIFDAEHRSYYDLELLWGDAPRIEWEKPSST